jgi:hypothetical protein
MSSDHFAIPGQVTRLPKLASSPTHPRCTPNLLRLRTKLNKPFLAIAGREENTVGSLVGSDAVHLLGHGEAVVWLRRCVVVAGFGEVGACADVDCAGVAVLARFDACGGCETGEEESGQ